MKGIDLFSGARGWDIAARHLGWHMDGVENWAPANATAAAAGFRTVHEDVRTFHAEHGQYDILLGSPSCKRYSPAGNGAGRRALDAVLSCVRPDITTAEAQQIIGDDDAALVIEPLRIIMECRPTFIALEQAIAVLSVWQAHARVLEDVGYSVATGILNAEQYGVPQTRRRAILVARRDGPTAALPSPTHSRYYSTDPTRLDAGIKPWVSMAEALGWDQDATVVRNCGTGGDPANRGTRESAEPFAAITSKADRFKITFRQPAMRNATRRDHDQPAPTITGAKDWRERVWLRNNNQPKACVRSDDQPSGTMFFGQRANWAGWEEKDGTLIRKVTPEEAACLQTFPAGHPFQGGKSQIMTQIGNAVPPLLAEAILSTFL